LIAIIKNIFELPIIIEQIIKNGKEVLKAVFICSLSLKINVNIVDENIKIPM
jgi:hypothetical protein